MVDIQRIISSEDSVHELKGASLRAVPKIRQLHPMTKAVIEERKKILQSLSKHVNSILGKSILDLSQILSDVTPFPFEKEKITNMQTGNHQIR